MDVANFRFPFLDYVGACFIGDIPLTYNVKFALFDTAAIINGYVTNFQPSVASNAFNLPSYCSFPGKLTAKPRSGSPMINHAIRNILRFM